MRGRHAAIAAIVLLAGAPAARAQGVAEPVSRADISVSAGWFNADKSELSSERHGNDWYNRSLYGGAAVGWYWTDHLKTELDGGATTGADLLVYTPTVIDGRLTTLYSTYTIGTTRLAISQQYQFYRNVWFHPFVGGGLDVTWERTRREDEIYSALPIRTQPFPTRTELLARPLADVGFKAYFTPRAFFRTDLKITFDKGVDEALVRFGFGMDF
jgi:outer membrane protein W